ncbi:epimerase family protein SDR39U1-like [Patiria miniata]|uniref:Epimerase family protein SDR39U1 n=1 Tax=Patiria miniata TaxID=46514 RepID=A0A914BN34_PATMI|nr:epimerase family protein SDR39U1-like [Patiria miniata]XP_038077547.1 epimerase family protein SDR39U1-like [Patiria miniata]
MFVLLGGGSGFVGTAIRRLLLQRGHSVQLVSRSAGKDKITWNQLRKEGLPECDAVVSLSGENILNPLRRWTESFKQEVTDSRVKTTAALAKAIADASKPPKVFVSTSGVGYYTPSLTAEYTEDSPGGDSDFLARLCTEWENSAKLPDSHSHVRQVIIRTGVVLGRDGGAIQQMIWPFWLGVGGIMGSGNQYFPWIHIDDIAGIFVHAIESPNCPPVLNGTAPTPVTNREFTKAFGSALCRPTVLPAPGFAINWAFGAERAVMLLEGQKVLPKRTLESGYEFQYPTIEQALKNVTS